MHMLLRFAGRGGCTWPPLSRLTRRRFAAAWSLQTPVLCTASSLRLACRRVSTGANNLSRSPTWLRDFARAGLPSWRRVFLGLPVGLLAGYGIYQTSVGPSPTLTTLCLEEEEEEEELPLRTTEVVPFLPGYDFTLFESLHLAFRFAYLGVIFLPALLLCSLGYLFSSARLTDLAWRYSLRVVQIAGPAFIKLGQWAATRRDLFNAEFCSTLSGLYTRCEPHCWADTERVLVENFGSEWGEVLAVTDREPIGSGSVAQVYKGVLKYPGEEEEWEEERHGRSCDCPAGRKRVAVAIKVLHPGIVKALERDICLMKYVAGWVDWLYPEVHWVALKECLNEFSTSMQNQLDLQMEAENLWQFRELHCNSCYVRFPHPIAPYVTNDMLVESFEEGTLISEYLDNPGGALQKHLAQIGLKILMDMMFDHNFVHGDLHPGNILVADASLDHPKLTLLDCGIATRLDPIDLKYFRAVFKAIVKGDGERVADLFLGTQPCATVEAYRQSMAELVGSSIQCLNLRETRMNELFSNLFNILIEHKVRITPSYTSVMTAMMVIEGLGRSLDPSLDILAIARPYLLRAALRPALGSQRSRRSA